MRLIDADELTELVHWDYGKPPFSRKKVLNMIDMARTIDAVPVRHGRWTADETLYTQGMVACSCCKTEYYRDDLDIIMPKYCPECGARMDVNET